jgi:acetyl esterase/lipase
MRHALSLLLVALLLTPTLAQEKAKDAQNAGLLEKVSIETDVEYAKAGDVSLKLDIYKPKAESSQPRPCIVWIHGGGWQGGNKSSGQGLLVPRVAGGNFVGVSVGYRLTNVAAFPAQIHDCKAAIRYVRANAAKLGIDPNKIGVWGSSAGGHLVSLLGTSGDVKEVEGSLGTTGVSSRVACVVDYCGPSDFPNFELTDGARGPINKLLGGLPKDTPEIAKQASPITYITKDDPPFLVVHGTNDATVPFDQGLRFSEALKKGGVDAALIRIEGGGHGIGGQEINSRVNAFFEKYLLGKTVTVSAESIKAPAPADKAK